MTDRKRAEEVLTRVGGQHAAIAQLGKDAVSGFLPETLLAEGAKQIRRVLHADFAGVFVTPPDERGLRLVASERSQGIPRPVGEPGHGTQPGYTLGTSEPIVMDDARTEARFEAWPSGLASAVTVRMQSGEQRFGVVEAAFRLPRHLEPDEITFLESVANLLAAAVARFRAEGQMRHQALHDPLTGLPNRSLFLDRLEHAMALARRHEIGLAVVFADLDGFKAVNDDFGHLVGDDLLISLSERLRGALRSSDSLARFGGDEFIMVLEDVAGDGELQRAVDRIRAAVSDEPFMIADEPHSLELAIGVVRADESHGSPDDLVRDADAAMYQAKQRGRGGYALFDRDMREHEAARAHLVDQLRVAADGGELRLLYQPIVALDTGRVVELEALLRWQHPERGLLEPGEFLDLAVESRLIVPIGQWVLHEACRQAASWQAMGLIGDALTINVNMSPGELAQRALRETVRAASEQAGVRVPLQLELTEGALIEDPALPATLRELSSDLGVRAALDDFGTGYSSLAYLARFKIDELKIDRSFISALTPGRDAPIVAAIVSMAHALDILVVAEGIETEHQAAEARRLGCDRGQGYLYAPPLPPETIPALLNGGVLNGRNGRA